jgi:hypothetical protein
MPLTAHQVQLLVADLDYILPRTRCDSVHLSKSGILRAVERDPSVLIELVEGLPPADARWLSVPIDEIRRANSRPQSATADPGPLLFSGSEF